MAKNPKTKRTAIKDLVVAVQELTEQQMTQVQGGATTTLTPAKPGSSSGTTAIGQCRTCHQVRCTCGTTI